MRVLALDTTTPPGSAAFLRPGAAPLVSAPADTRPFGERLPGWLLALLAGADATMRDVELFVVGAGPGSLTGLRVGLATMQGLATATGRPLLGVSTLEALAQHALDRAGPAPHRRFAACANARRGEVFAQLFAPAVSDLLEPCGPPAVGSLAEVADRWAPALAGVTLVVSGDAAQGSEPAWLAHGARAVSVIPAVPLAIVMARIGVRRAALGEAGAPGAVQPLYVRRPDAELARERATRGVKPHVGG